MCVANIDVSNSKVPDILFFCNGTDYAIEVLKEIALWVDCSGASKLPPFFAGEVSMKFRREVCIELVVVIDPRCGENEVERVVARGFFNISSVCFANGAFFIFIYAVYARNGISATIH